MSNKPLVSIAIPAFNPRFFETALLSALAQSYSPLEILISDDCPDDAIQSIVARHAPACRHTLRVIRNQPSLGGQLNLNQCVHESRGEFVKVLNDDDVLLGNCVERMVDVLERFPEVNLVSSKRILIDGMGVPLADILATCNPFEHDTLVQGADLIAYLCDRPLNFIGEPSTVLFRRAPLLSLTPHICSLGGQDVRGINDLAIYVNLLHSGHFAYLTEPLSCFRWHAEQRQQQDEVKGLFRTGVRVFAEQIHALGWYQPQDDGQVRAQPLQEESAWQLYPLQACFEQAARLLEQRAAMTRPQSVQLWLDERLPTPIQNRLINDYLLEHQGGPRIGVFVLDLEADNDRLMATLRSLGLEQSQYATLKIVVLSTAKNLPNTRPAEKLHFVPVTVENYVERLNQSAAQTEVEWLLLVQAGDVFTASGLMVLALELLQAESCRAVYADGLQRSDAGLGAAFRPDFNLDLFLSLPVMMARYWLYRRDVLLAAGGFDARYPDALEFQLLLRLIESGGTAGLGHVDEPLLISDAPRLVNNSDEQTVLLDHLRARGYLDAQLKPNLPGRYRIDYGHQHQPLVSIIVPTKDQLPVLQRCVESLLEKTAYQHYELIIVDNASETPEAQAWLQGVEVMGDAKVRVLRYPHPFNYSAINNMAAKHARGEYLVLLNNDTAVISESWLDELLNHAQRPEVGIVGAKLLYPSGKIQHAGVLLGLRGPAEHPFTGQAMDAPGYMQRLQVDQNYSAVTAACLMIRKSVYEVVGGLDEAQFKVSYNDVDLCLKVGQSGYLIVWAANSVLMHEGSVSQKRIDPKAAQAKYERFMGEQDAMYQKWLPQLARDPAYNRNLSLNGQGFELESDVQLNWRPLTWRPLPVVLAHPADPWGCGHYRVIQPFGALRKNGDIDGMLSEGLLQVVELERYQPDVIILQRQIGDKRLEAMRRIKAFSKAFKVYELDDYLPNLPLKNQHREHMPKDVLKSLRKGLSFVDRFVVSTPALAEAFAGQHGDIQVVQNRLDPLWWRGLEAQRRVASKPRVGWAGGVSHTGDLEMIADIIKELADEVHWVFMGMCPEKLRPYVHEYHAGVDIQQYPQALAQLNLDLALAPLEQNMFNDCKSNLRLLEYGACGFPVICSDVRCYQDDLPVMRVRNRFKDWVDAIRMHLADLDAAARSGDELRARVMQDWMLEGDALQQWRKAWGVES